MTYLRKFMTILKFKLTSNNAGRRRFRRIDSHQLITARLSAEVSNSSDLVNLILLGDFLDTPVRYDFGKPHTAYIEVTSVEKLQAVDRGK